MHGIDLPKEHNSRTSAIRFILLLGVVSLFADMTYEAARSLAGPYLAIPGACIILTIAALLNFSPNFE
jgi:hypothetical protein